MTEESAPSPSIIQRAEAIHKAMKEIRQLNAARQVRDGLAMRNGPNTSSILNLPIQSDVRVWREKDGWTGPFKLLTVNGETCTIQMPYGAANFRTTVVKPYHAEQTLETARNEAVLDNGEEGDEAESGNESRAGGSEQEPEIEHEPKPKRGRGRPKGSRNKPKTHFNNAEEDFSAVFLSNKEKEDRELSLQLRNEGKITTPGQPFEASDQQEIDHLIGRGVFRFEQYDAGRHEGIHIFKSRMVNEIKGKTTEIPYEKSRLVIQGYQDNGKEVILTQAPTIQRASQRLILALTPSLMHMGMHLWLRDITQAYTQSETKLNRTILARLPKQLIHRYPEGTIMIVVKPLYGIAEAGTHWWATYSKHHKERLHMITSTYDPCLMITTGPERTRFAIVGMQTDDTIILANDEFSNLEQDELEKAHFTAKPKQMLTTTEPMMFNGCTLTQQDDGTLYLRQKGQGKKISLIATGSDLRQEYVQQRARGAYIASICQPEATFDLSTAAQCQEPTRLEAETLNKRLKWQMEHLNRGLKYIRLDLETAKIFVFVDGSFANNKDLSSQLGYEIILANETMKSDEFAINGNLVHWSSTKSKRVTRSVLASEIYGMVGGVDMAIAIGTTLQMITDQLTLPTIPIIVCTDSYSLYECLVKLGTTKEKRLMIDIMALRQSYECRELFEIRWINGHDNPADAMTKSNPNKALEQFIETNTLRVRIEGWVQRD